MKRKLGLNLPELEDQPEPSGDELEDSLSDHGRQRGRGARNGTLGDWDKIGWMAAGMLRRVPGVEFMLVSQMAFLFKSNAIRLGMGLSKLSSRNARPPIERVAALSNLKSNPSGFRPQMKARRKQTVHQLSSRS